MTDVVTAAFGWRARIALILPADNVVMEPELTGLGLAGVSFHGLRLTSIEPDVMRSQAVELASTLLEMGVDAAVYACAETSFNGGDSVRLTLADLIAQRCGLPVVTATTAMLEAIRTLGIRRPSVLTPYSARSGELFEGTLADAGADVQSARHHAFRMESDDPREWYLTNRQSAGAVLDLVRDIDLSRSDGLVIAATNIPALSAISALEQSLGVPVVTSNQSILWWCLNRLGLSDRFPDLGRLLLPGSSTPDSSTPMRLPGIARPSAPPAMQIAPAPSPRPPG